MIGYTASPGLSWTTANYFDQQTKNAHPGEAV